MKSLKYDGEAGCGGNAEDSWKAGWELSENNKQNQQGWC